LGLVLDLILGGCIAFAHYFLLLYGCYLCRCEVASKIWRNFITTGPVSQEIITL